MFHRGPPDAALAAAEGVSEGPGRGVPRQRRDRPRRVDSGGDLQLGRILLSQALQVDLTASQIECRLDAPPVAEGLVEARREGDGRLVADRGGHADDAINRFGDPRGLGPRIQAFKTAHRMLSLRVAKSRRRAAGDTGVLLPVRSSRMISRSCSRAR